MANQATITREQSRKATSRDNIIAKATRPNQSAAMTAFLNRLSHLDEVAFEHWFLPSLRSSSYAGGNHAAA